MKLRLNPSSAKTWTSCTAQPQYVADNKEHIPADLSSEYSREGDAGHQVVENLFNEAAVEYKVTGFKEDMQRHAQSFVKYCLSLTGMKMNQRDKTWWSERKVSLFYAPESNGKIDFSARKSDHVYICDYKYGQGVAVHAEENLQMAIYAVSLIQADCPNFDRFNKVTMAIFQPRVRDGEPVTTWTLTYGELLNFVEEAIGLPVTQIQAKKDLRFSPSAEVCQFCPAKGFCGLDGYEPKFKYAGHPRAIALLEDTPLAPVRKGLPARLMKPVEMEQDQLTRIVLQAKAIEKWLKDVAAYAEGMLKDGKPVAGLKLVQGRGGHRVWREEDEARILLLQHLTREDVIAEKLVSPSQCDKFEHDLPKDAWQQIKTLQFKPEGGPTVVAENDPRPRFGQVQASDYFESEPVEEDWV